MAWDDDNYSGGSDTFNTVGSTYTSKRRKTKLPHLRPIVKKRKRVPRTDFGEAMSGLTLGMLFVFPTLAGLAMAFPLGFFSIIGVIALIIGLWSQSVKAALIILGICLGMVLLGFLSIGLFMAIFL